MQVLWVKQGYCLCFLSLIIILAACSGSSSGNKQTQVTVTPVVVSRVQQLQQQQQQLTLSGATEANATVNVSFKVSGTIAAVHAKEGDAVHAGMLLASIDATSYQYSLDASNAELAKANDQYQRATIMKNRESLTEADFQKASSGLQQAQALQQQAVKTVRDTRLYAPATGIVSRRNAEPGENVAMGIPVFTIVSIKPIQVKANVPESEIGKVHKGGQATVNIPALQQQYNGTITEIGAVADALSRAYTVKITLPNNDGRIRAGMIANATLDAGTASGAVTTLPGDAVLHDPDGTAYVFIADSAKKQAYKRTISIGQLNGNSITIATGLTGKEWVVTGGQQKLQDGAFIQFKAPAP